MVAYTSAFLAAAHLLALVHAAPAQPVCQAVITVVTGSPIWVPRADPTSSAGWGAWSPMGSSSSPSVSKSTKTGPTWTVSPSQSTWTTSTPVTYTTPTWTTSTPVSTTVSPTTITISTPSPTTAAPTTAAPTTSTPAPAQPTCDTVTHNVFSAPSTSGSCGCDFTVNCNRHAPYTSSTSFWERTTGEIIATLQDCLNICNDNSDCQAVVWSNQDGESSNDYMRCWQTSGLPQPDSDGYGQLSYKGACSSSCSQSYNTSG